MLEKKILLVLASLSLTALMGCSSGGGGDDDLDIAEIQEIEQTGEFSEDEFFASEDVDNISEEQLVEEVPGLEEDLEVSQEELEASGNEGFEVDLAEEEQDLFAESGLAEDNLLEEGSIAQNNEISEDELDGLLEEDLGEDDFSVGGTEPGVEGENFNDEQLALESEEDLFRDLEDESTGQTYSDTTSEPSASDLLADDEMNYSSEASQNYQDSSSDIIAEDINVDVDYSQAMAEDNSLNETTEPKKSYIPVKKMKTVPYDRNGVLVNAIYFVREGDTLRSIADKVYGAGSAVDFTIVNPHLKEGSLRVGQKVYYNSPSRPQDRSRLLTYYEDARAPMMNYSAREGENIREISKSLLGHPRSWMEVWASNLQIESKGALESPYQIRYWEGAPATPAAPTLAQNQFEEPAPTNQANLDMSDSELGVNNGGGMNDFEEPVQDVAANDATFDSDTLEEPIVEDDFTDELSEDLAAVGSVQDPPSNAGGNTFDDNAGLDNGFDGELANDDPMAAEGVDPNSEANPRNVALNNTGGGFPAQNKGGIAALMNDPGQMGIVAAALLLLLGVGFIVIRRRRASAEEAIEMESFDFGGETVIEDEVNKTQVDI